jgi:glycosyltransferase involved in cell wall biosynthesis
MITRLAVVIPAYRPSAGLIDLVRQLSEKAFPAIVIVDDGSGAEYRDTFAEAAAFPHVQLLRHAVNLGKGAALKTAFNHILCSMPDAVGVVTADADGQHHPEDIERVANALLERPDALVLGARAFDGAVPLRSRIGNVATRRIMQALLGRRLTDTQTGLRGIPSTLLGRLLRVEATGYEFELEMLLAAHHLSVPILEQTIRTIYEPGNPSSHFNPLIDSMKIYFVLLRFGSVSLMTAVLDNLIFALTVHRFGSVLGSQAFSRVFALAFNYGLVRSSVFYTKQRHQSTLPKYIALTVGIGACSYAAITMLSRNYGVGVISAKLLVETFLFFVNFAIQRAFIFKAHEGETGDEPAPRVPRFAYVLGAVFLALVAVEIYGFRTANLFAQRIWNPDGLHRFARFAQVYAVAAAVLLVAAPRSMPIILAGVIAILTAVSVGPVALLATAFFLISANALGSILLRTRKPENVADQVCSTLLGAGVYTFVMSLAARQAIHYPAVWIGVLAAPVMLDLRGVRNRITGWVALSRPYRAPGLSERASFAVLAFVLIAHWFVALKPEASSDGLAMHLTIPANIALNHGLTLEPSRWLWAVFPMGADFAYAVVYLLGGEYASRLLVFAMLLGVCALLYAVLRRWTTPTAAYLLTAVFATTPIVQLVTGAMFVENFLAAMILGMLTAIWRFGDTGELRYFYAAMALGGSAMTVKFGAVIFVAVALPFALIELRRHWKSVRRPAAACVFGVVLLVAAAAPPYAIAYAKTGNPLFPFLNTKFRSPLLPEGVEIKDERFREKLSWRTLYDMTFATTNYYEGQKGSLGFHFLPLVPLGLLGLAVARRRQAVSAAAVAFGAGAIIMSTEPNARYLYAAMPLALVPVGTTLAWVAAHQRAFYRTLLAFLAGVTALNCYFLPSSSYYHKDFTLRQPFSRAARERYLGDAAPIRVVIQYFNQTHPKEAVLFTHDGASATTDGDVYENHWHQIGNFQRIHEAPDVPAMLALMNRWKVRYFIARKPEPGDKPDPPQLTAFLTACTLPEFEAGNFYLARIEPGCNAGAIAAPAIVVRPGYYDAYDPALLYRGEWKKTAGETGPDRQSRAVSNAPGAEVSMAFDGKSLLFVYAKGPDHGIASVTIDGTAKDPIDMYAPEVQWQHYARYCCFSPGRHEIVVRATGERNPGSAGQSLSLDSFSIQD